MSDDEVELDDEILDAASAGIVTYNSPRDAPHEPSQNYTYNSTIYFQVD
jgi:hypothetical protein